MAVSKKKLITIGGAGAAAVLGLGLLVPAVAFAEGATSSPSASATPAPGKGSTDREQRHAEHQQALAEGLAKELGIDQDKVEAALEKVQSQLRSEANADRQAQLKTRLDQAVKDGKLTQEQVDAILKAAESGALPGGGFGGHGRGGPR